MFGCPPNRVNFKVKMASAEIARHLDLVLSVANRAIDDL
jgi:hypothetical protein